MFKYRTRFLIIFLKYLYKIEEMRTYIAGSIDRICIYVTYKYIYTLLNTIYSNVNRNTTLYTIQHHYTHLYIYNYI